MFENFFRRLLVMLVYATTLLLAARMTGVDVQHDWDLMWLIGALLMWDAAGILDNLIMQRKG